MTRPRPTEIPARPQRERRERRTCTPPPRGHIAADQLWQWALSNPGKRPFGVRNEQGFVAVEWVLAIALILMPVVGMAGAAVNWPGRLNAASEAAYEAARAVITSPTADEGEGVERAREVWANHGWSGDISVSFEGDPLSRRASFTATVTVPLPVVAFPGAGLIGGADVSRSSTQRVADYRSVG